MSSARKELLTSPLACCTGLAASARQKACMAWSPGQTSSSFHLQLIKVRMLE